MKKVILMLSVVLLFSADMAGSATRATFYSAFGERFVLTINGKRINHYPTNEVTLNHYYSGRTHVHVLIRNNGYSYELNHPVFLKQGFNNGFEILQNRYGDFFIKKSFMKPLYRTQRGDRLYFPKRLGKKDSYHKNGFHHNYINTDRLVYDLSHIHSDQGKLSYATNAIYGKLMHVRDVRRIMNQFYFDRTRVKFAIYAYDNTIDRGNYSRLGSALHHPFSRNKLEKFLYYK